MFSRRLYAVLGVAASAVALTTVGGFSADAASSPHTIARSGGGQVTSVGVVDLAKLPAARAAHAWNHGPLLRSGSFSGSQLPSRPSSGSKTAGITPKVALKKKSPFNGIDRANANCTCEPPDVNAAIGPANIVESVNLDLAVYTKTGTLQQSTALNTFFGTSDSLSDPRVVFDPTYNRWGLSLTDVTAPGGTPSLWFAVSTSSKPDGSWFRYHIGFSGGSFPAGELLDYPVLGMDADAWLISTNNFAQPSAGNFTYNGSTVFAMPKARLYNGFGFSFGAFVVPFGTAPAIVGGHPTQNNGRTYLLDADDTNDQMHLYFMTNTARPDSTTLTKQFDISYVWAAPARRVNQPGTTTTLDPLDGRIVWAPTQLDNRVWFAHGINVSGFPAVNYGFVDTTNNTITTATAFHSSSSDDFNPSIAAENGPNGVQAVLSWASTDTAANMPTTDFFAINAGTTLSHQAGTSFGPVGASTNETRFGDFSSVSPEYNAVGTCGEGTYALVANQYFEAGGAWTTRLSQVGLC